MLAVIGQFISKSFFLFRILPKNERNNSIIVLLLRQTNKFVCSFVFTFLEESSLKKPLRLCITFSFDGKVSELQMMSRLDLYPWGIYWLSHFFDWNPRPTTCRVGLVPWLDGSL